MPKEKKPEQQEPISSNSWSIEVPALLKTHYEHLKKSGISDEVITERGYLSMERIPRESKSAGLFLNQQQFNLSELGFSKKQLRVPGILMPVHNVNGKIATYQYRPDKPRTDEKFRPIKYENPPDQPVCFDIPPRCQSMKDNPHLPAFITEGIKKTDSLATKGVFAIGLTGVWGFKGTNSFGGKTIQADFDYVAWNSRLVYLVFDSDIITKTSVQMALNRLSEHLTRKQAYVRVLQLPPGPDGEKVGVDDYFMQGHTIDDLIACEQITPTVMYSLKERSNNLYTINEGCLCAIKDDIPNPLCNFSAKITEDILKDDGKTQVRWYKVSGINLKNQTLASIEIQAKDYKSLNWIPDAWGSKALVYAGSNTQDNLRVAIQIQNEPVFKTVYTHTGWREINGNWLYLTHAGAIGDKNIMVELEDTLKTYSLPIPIGDIADPVKAMKYSLAFLDISKHDNTLPLWSMMFLAPLCHFIDPAFTFWFNGQSGSFKSTITALCMNHFGAFKDTNLPDNWTSTENLLEKRLCICKDIPFVIDDFAPGASSYASRQLETKAERIIRSQGNRQSRGRMMSDTSTRPSYTPRGLLISSGEHVPGGESRNARMFTVDIEREDTDMKKLTEAQHNAKYYRVAMYYYLVWIREHWKEFEESLMLQWEKYRVEFQNSSIHPRLHDVVASLYTGLSMGIAYAASIKAIDKKEASKLLKEGKEIFRRLSREQGERVESERSGKMFIEALKSLISTGAVRLRDRDDETDPTPVPGQPIIGWEDTMNGHILLDPDMSMMVIKKFYNAKDNPLTVKDKAVFRDLQRLGYTDSDPGRSLKNERFGNITRRIIAIKRAVLEDVDFDGK